jgi:hypothetical protein
MSSGEIGLLEPLDVELFQLAAQTDRSGHREAVIGVDHQLDAGADRLADGFHALEVALDRSKADLHLDRLEAGLDVARGFLDRFLDQTVHVSEIEPGGVGVDLGAEGTADQLVHRLVAGFAGSVLR